MSFSISNCWIFIHLVVHCISRGTWDSTDVFTSHSVFLQSIFPSQVTFWFQYHLIHFLLCLLPLSALHHPLMLLFKHASCSDKYHIELGQEEFSAELSLAHVPVWLWIANIYQPTDWKQRCREGLRSPDGQVDHEAAMCPCSKEGPQHPGLH